MKKNQGFVGLIALMIAVAIIALIVVRTDLFNLETKVIDENGEATTEEKGFLEVGTDAIDRAKGVKADLEARDQKMMEEF